MMNRTRPRALPLAVALAAAIAAAAPADAQSLTSIRGLGYPLTPVDARGEILGGLGIGLQGLSAPFINPASAAGLSRPGVVTSVAAMEQTAQLGDATDSFGATRFPLLQVLFPMGSVVVTAGYGGYLDQSWGVAFDGEQETGGTTITYRDLVRSTGGIGQFQLGAAIPMGQRLALGLAVGVHSGERRLEHQRLFDTVSLGVLESFTQVRTVRYFGPMAQIGARWDPVDPLRVAASVTWGGTLEADSISGPAESAEYQLPLQVAAGASAYLAPSLLAAVSGRWSGWSSVGRIVNLDAGGLDSSGRDTWQVGGGLEWDDPDRRAARSFPVRIGGSYRQLPFAFAEEGPREWFVGGGVGMRIGPSVDNPLGRIDLTVQRGERTAPGYVDSGALTETAWRFVLSAALFGD